VTQPLHTSQLIKNLGNTSIAYKPRHTHTHIHPWNTRSQGKTHYAILVFPGFFYELWSVWVTYCHRCLTCFKGLCVCAPRYVTLWLVIDPCVIFCGRVYCDILSIFLVPQFCLFLRHQTMDEVQKHNSFNTNAPSSESYRNYLPTFTVRMLCRIVRSVWIPVRPN
jgi:hypothetical protein